MAYFSVVKNDRKMFRTVFKFSNALFNALISGETRSGMSNMHLVQLPFGPRLVGVAWSFGFFIALAVFGVINADIRALENQEVPPRPLHWSQIAPVVLYLGSDLLALAREIHHRGMHHIVRDLVGLQMAVPPSQLEIDSGEVGKQNNSLLR
ncbi:hypothetical protein BJ165DRAFT_1410593 [Panaeolus papilionaceus]|nr:hypothetical protein BJ165DRAFT_1410593 [Panaeolus papilionaceus]